MPTPPTAADSPNEPSGVARQLPPLIVLSDLAAQLIWPRLLRVPAAALWPSRLLLGVIGAALAGLLGSLNTLWSDRPGIGAALERVVAGGLGSAVTRGVALDADAAAREVVRALVTGPADLALAYPVSLPVLGLAMLGALVAVGGGIARSVAEEGATGTRPSAARMLGWSLARWPSAFAAVAVPFVALGLGVVLLRSLGWLGFALPGVNVVGAVLLPLGVALGLAMAVLAVGLGLGGIMVVPARAAEDSDAIDALQRALAYVVARPLRLVAYLAIALGVSALALGVARGLVVGGWELTVQQAGAWLSESREAALSGVAPPGDDGAPGTLGGTERIAHWFVNLWGGVPVVLVSGYAISLFVTAGTRVYLAMREVCDGQDPSEIQGAARADAGA